MFEAAPHPDTLKFVIAAVAVVAALFFLLLDYSARARAKRARAWPATDGTVETSRTARRWGLGNGLWMAGLWYVPEVIYRYEIGGEKYSARRVFLSDAGFAKLRKAKDVIERYPRGSTVAVHYDPANPKRACLEPAYREHRALGTAVLLLGIAAAALLT